MPLVCPVLLEISSRCSDNLTRRISQDRPTLKPPPTFAFAARGQLYHTSVSFSSQGVLQSMARTANLWGTGV
jgi:hypothetical protein